MKAILQKTHHKGFALVVTLSLMILLTAIAVGLLSLSSISLRSSNQGQAMAIAKSNARMALMLAIGELQRQTGPDTRITARANVLDDKNPPVLGVWKSWEGTDHETTGTYAGRPVSPGDYGTKKKERFLAWLVSGSNTTLPNTSPASNKITLVGAGSVGQGADREKLQVNLTPSEITVAGQRGAFAWWVGGENQKARIPKPCEPASDTVAGWSAQSKSHSVADTKPFRMEKLLNDAAPAAKAISLHQADLIADKKGNLSASSEFFYDLSTSSVGLLTNTATGGWRKDLSLLTENWSLLPKTNQPFFRVTPGNDILFNIPVSGGSYRPDKSLIYPWSAYRGGNNWPIGEHGAVSSWENLKNWATLYKSMTNNGTQIATQSSQIFSNDAVSNFNFLHKVRILPVIARIQWVFSHSAGPSTAPAPANTFTPRLLVTPVVTLWNPYNVTLTSSPNIKIVLAGTLPNAFKYNVNGIQNLRINSVTNSSNNTPPLAPDVILNYKIATSYTFKPGETLLFSPTATPVASNIDVNLQPGFRKQGGHYFTLKKDDGTNFNGIPGTAIIKADATFNSYNTAWGSGIGIYLDMFIGTTPHLAYRMFYDATVAATVYPPISGLASTTLAEANAAPQPFLTTIFGARTASTTHLAAKGFLQSSPLVNYTTMGNQSAGEPGTAHPVNSPFDYSFAKLAASGGSEYPNTDAANHGFIITGFQSGDGLSRCVLAELPTKPIQSLAELQNWDIRYENPIPPYAFNIIGNSDATPLIPSNAVFIAGNSSKGAQDLQHDDFYCANHILFDDWFVSSIAPKTANLGTPSASETLKKTFTDFVSGKDPLPNNAYLPILADTSVGASTAGAEGLFTNYVNQPASWKSIASRLEVDGMFNVNSTSVTAWRSLLGHARNRKTPYVTSTGNNLSGKEDYTFSRFAVAGDVEAKSIGSSGAFSSSAEFAGYRKLDEKTLDRLAEEIVKQIKTRGPFLSLSEFVNRQLTSSTDEKALAGTIQAALNVLEKDSAINPFSIIQAGSKKSSIDPLPSGSAGYSFAAAAAGYNAYGLPGWTRQADVLRAIAPILSARDDTFTLRAYGDARDPSGKIITARATCEAVIRRTRDYVDPTDAAELTTLLSSALNITFGRHYQIVSFCWLSSSEI